MIARLCITLNLLLCCCLYGQGNVVTDSILGKPLVRPVRPEQV